MKIAVVIPARMSSSRLPNKPLASVHGLPMVVQVLKRGAEANIGDVFVACSEQVVYDAVVEAGGHAIMTDPELPSGTDRVAAALDRLDADYDIIVNLQGDLPTVPASVIRDVVKPFETHYDETDVSTLVVRVALDDEEEAYQNPHTVKAAVSFEDGEESQGKALYFSRSPLKASNGHMYHHIGMYAYKRESLARFVTLPASPMEKFEKLEQLRGLENGMRFQARVVDWAHFEVNTPEDLKKVT